MLAKIQLWCKIVVGLYSTEAPVTDDTRCGIIEPQLFESYKF